MSGSAGSARPVAYHTVLRQPEFAGLTVAQVTSECGDHFARVGLASLVLARGGSFVLAALAFVSSYVPAVFGSALLSPLADRLPRRGLLLTCDAVRAALVGVLALVAVPSTPLWVLYALLFLGAAFTAPFDAARAALLPDVLPDRLHYLAGAGLVRVLYQADQVLGLALAGLVVHLLAPRGALAVDAASFGISFVVLLLALRPRRAPVADGAVPAGRGVARWARDVAEGARHVFGDPRRRALVAVACIAAVFLIAPEGVALAYAAEEDRSETWGGVLMASVPFGAAVGAAAVSRWTHVAQLGAVLPLAAVAAIPLVLTAAHPPVGAAAVLWGLSGACQGFMVTVMATVNVLTPPAFRGRVNGMAAACLAVAGSAGYLLAGTLADLLDPATAVAIAGGAALVAVAVLARWWPAGSLRDAAQASPSAV